jgi:spore maturation protein CgeB
MNINSFDLLGKSYAQAISSAKVTLCFLRKINRDLHTSRSVEIPACGGFMLAERTVEHSSLFKEGEEAEFFSNKNELLDKVRYYLSNDKQRKLISNNGLIRARNSGYSYDDMVQRIINVISNN